MVGMEPLTGDSFKDILRIKLQAALKRNLNPSDIDELFGDNLLKYLVPETNPPIAATRTSLVIVERMIRALPGLPASVTPFSETTLETVVDQLTGSRRIDSVDEIRFIHRLHEYVYANHTSDKPFEALTYDDLRKIYTPIGADEQSYKEFIQEMILNKVLLAAGVPYTNPEQSRYVEPFLPTTETFLEAAYFPAAPYTEREEQTSADVVMRRQILSRLQVLEETGLIPPGVIDLKRIEALKLTDVIDAYLRGDMGLPDFIKVHSQRISEVS
jgi:hypothetical protein